MATLAPLRYAVKRVDRNSLEFRNILREIAGVRRMSEGRYIAIRACLGAEDTGLAVAFFRSGKVAGAANFRIEARAIKRVNMGVLLCRRGIGTALVKFIVRSHLGFAMYSKNQNDGKKFAMAIGMSAGARDGRRRLHHWTAEEARQWAMH